MELTHEQINRARGMVLGAAVGDALGAGYEFAHIPEGLIPEMIGGGLGDFAPGEWTDDTSLTWIVAEAAAEYKTFFGADPMNAVARGFRAWYDTNPPDIGGTTAWAIRGGGKDPDCARMKRSAMTVSGDTNGSLMRTSPVVLPYVGNPVSLISAARQVSELTHASPDAVEACMIWSAILNHAVVTGELDVQASLSVFYQPYHDRWHKIVAEAMETDPKEFAPNGKAVAALQAALSAVVHTEGYDFRESLYTAVRIGWDTDTVASIAGALVGALHGIDAIPTEWLEILHGYPGKTGEDLDNLVIKALN
jgi:ADP-ribosylglycohydrolase